MTGAVLTCTLRELQWLLDGLDLNALKQPKRLAIQRIQARPPARFAVSWRHVECRCPPLPNDPGQLRALCAQLQGQLAQQSALVEQQAALVEQQAALVEQKAARIAEQDRTIRARQQTIEYLQEKLALLPMYLKPGMVTG